LRKEVFILKYWKRWLMVILVWSLLLLLFLLLILFLPHLLVSLVWAMRVQVKKNINKLQTKIRKRFMC
jgi:hypothetical protein